MNKQTRQPLLTEIVARFFVFLIPKKAYKRVVFVVMFVEKLGRFAYIFLAYGGLCQFLLLVVE